MYLFERMLGVVTYMGIMLVFIYLIYNSNSKKKLKKYLIIYWFLLAIMAFFYIPSKSADLTRLIETMHKYAQMNFESLFKLMNKTNLPSECLYFWCIGIIGIDGLLPSITSLIFFGNVFSITYKVACKYDIDNKNIAIALLFFMELGKFLEVISGIRALMAFSIIAWCAYTEMVEGKNFLKNIILYIFASLMHHAAMILTLIRLMFLLIQKEKKITRKNINIIIFILLSFLIFKLAYNNIEAAIGKANLYIENAMYSYIWEYMICWIYVTFSTYTLIRYRKYVINNVEMENLRRFNLFINFIVIILNWEYSIFNRFSTFSGILFIPIFSFILQKMSKEQSKNKNFTYIFLLVTIFVFILVGTRGNLSGYKFLLFK